MVLYQYAIERWVKPVIAKRRDEGRAEGIAAANRQWEAWLQRKAKAESQGLPFNEPRPGAEEQLRD